MSEFLRLLPPSEALQSLLDHLPAVQPRGEDVALEDSLGRVSLDAIAAREALPAFARSTVDGYAVRARDTFGSSESLPAYLGLAGEVAMGRAVEFALLPGQAALIHTGGMLPPGADAVVMVEHTQSADRSDIEVLRAVAPGENVLQIGEDVQQGDLVLPGATRLRPAEVGGLAALGITRLRVAARPRVAILSSGDEIVAPHQAVHPGQVRDVNSYTLAALVAQEGGQARCYGILPDVFEPLQAALRQAWEECDLVVVTAGSSASQRDLTGAAIATLGSPGVLAHGVNLRPGKPTILAACQGKAVVGLPGNPVSAFVVGRLFVRPLIARLLGLDWRPGPGLQARLSVNVPSQAGREDYLPVRLSWEGGVWQADPLFYKSNLIFSLVQADGIARIPADANGIEAGGWVEVDKL